MLDSSLIVGVWRGYESAEEHLHSARRDWTLVISPIVHTELFAHPGIPESGISEFLEETGISVAGISNEVFTLAGRRYAAFVARRRPTVGSGPRRIAADFIIGAHAMTVASVLVTLDTRFFGRNFPELSLVGG